MDRAGRADGAQNVVVDKADIGKQQVFRNSLHVFGEDDAVALQPANAVGNKNVSRHVVRFINAGRDGEDLDRRCMTVADIVLHDEHRTNTALHAAFVGELSIIEVSKAGIIGRRVHLLG